MSIKESLKESYQYACTPPTSPGKEPNPIKPDEQNNQKVIIRTYTGNQDTATSLFQSDSVKMAGENYFPTSQSWTPGSYGCGSFIIAALLCFVIIGILAFIYMLIVKPDGTLTVTYELRNSNKTVLVEEKTCPKCAEQVKAAASLCRFCGHNFISPE
jgi:hypothetical protein